MAVITASKVTATDNELIYTFTGTGADTGTIAYATLVADCVAGSTLKTILSSVTGQCGSNTNAIAALITGSPFTGTASGKTITTNVEVKLVAATAAAIPFVTAADAGASNDPDINFGTAGIGQCWLYIKHVHSIVQ